ncbi:MAG: circularly permuted type 2 ATP-grasp protein [Kiritimatiellia bacterium]
MIANGNFSSVLPGGGSCYRERLASDGGRLDSWESFLSMVQESTPEERNRWNSTIRRELREDGLTFTLSPERQPEHRNEDLNPVPWIFSADQWQPVEAGVAQRARVLEAVARDLLGPRTLISRGVLPPELIFSDTRYLHPCIGLPPNMDSWLFQYAADLARGPDGQFRVLEDRTQVPSGAGYALESRTIMGRVFPKAISSMQVRRLAPYFRHLRESMLSLFQGLPLEPRVVLLTPGPYNPSYFEHAYLAAYLGFTLVQGSDLLVRNGSLKLKTLEGLQPIDILYRQIDAEYLDPLELKRDSFLGVPGLLGAMRTGKVATLNHPGCGLLENAGLLAFLAPLCRQLLGEELLLPSVATWWCGQPREFGYVLEHLDQLVVKPLHRKWDEPPVDGRFSSSLQLEELRRRIESHPAGYVAQEPMSYSSLPTLVGDRIEERIGSLRSFAFATRDGYEVMPGALARSGGDPESGPGGLLENKGTFKDVWVLGNQPEEHISLWLEQREEKGEEWFTGVFTSRSAENLFWAGRYAERLMRQTRLVRGIIQLDEGGLEDEIPSGELIRMVHLLETYSGVKKQKKEKTLARRLQDCLSGEKQPGGSMQRNLRSLLVAAYTVRDIWSQDSWRLLTEIEEVGQKCARPNTPPGSLESAFDDLVEKLNAFYGLNAYGMTRESGWSMLMLGRVLEAGIGLCELMRGLLERGEDDLAVSYNLMELALQQNENLITYRRHYRTTPKLHSVLSLMTRTEMNPRSLVFYLEHVNAYMDQLPSPVQPEMLQPVMLRIRQVRSGLLQQGSAWTDEEGRLIFLDEVREVLEWASVVVSSAYFSHTASRPRENF